MLVWVHRFVLNGAQYQPPHTRGGQLNESRGSIDRKGEETRREKGGLESSLVLSKRAILRARARFSVGGVEEQQQENRGRGADETPPIAEQEHAEVTSVGAAAARASAGPSKDAAKRWAAARAEDRSGAGVAVIPTADTANRTKPRLPALSLGNAALFRDASGAEDKSAASASGDESDPDEIVEL